MAIAKGVITLLLGSVVLSVLPLSCRHKPHYPEIGSILATSDPPGAEILIDGETIHRKTPSRMDGLPVGNHVLELRLANHHQLRHQIYVKPGELARINLKLRYISLVRTARMHLPAMALDLSYDPVNDRLFVASAGRISIYAIADSSIMFSWQMFIPDGVKKISASAPLNRVFAVFSDNGLVCVRALDMATGGHIWTKTLDSQSVIATLRLSPDQGRLLAADSAHNHLLIIDPTSGTLLDTINLAGKPADVCFHPGSGTAFTTLADVCRFSMFDLGSGHEISWLPAGQAPGDVFVSASGDRAVFCSSGDRSMTVVDVDSWTAATGFSVEPWTGCRWPSLCRDPLYMTVMMTVRGGGSVHTVFMPDWTMRSWFTTISTGSGHPDPDGDPVSMVRSQDGRYLYLLNQLTLWAVSMDI